MKNRLIGILWIVFLSISGYVSYIGFNNNTATANEVQILPRFVDVPRNSGFDLNIDLNSDKVVVNQADKDINVSIQKKDSIVYIPSIVEKNIVQYVKVSEMPPVRQPKARVANFAKGFSTEKINLNR